MRLREEDILKYLGQRAIVCPIYIKSTFMT